MTISIIIVNYNTCFFLEQCLCSLQKSIASYPILLPLGETEIIIIDNHSTDQSREYLFPKFPDVEFIFNDENTGFAKANNQALRQARGEYILFLNPDTILAEDTLFNCISFFSSCLDAAAIGVRMIDGKGHFLKESKRGFPFPWAAFCRLSGLSALFPHSKIFSSYYQGFLPEHETHEVEVLSGAFMFIRKKILDEIGGFDEQFFMYAEDIDLSYRICLAGYKNYYLANTSIIHFKGESTQKDDKYVHLFYKAMVQFIKKHFGSGIFVGLLQTAIWLRSRLSALSLRLVEKSKPVTKVIKTYLEGDATAIYRLEQRLHINGRQLTTDRKNASELVFCEGKNLSFKEIIRKMQVIKSSISIKIHAGNSSSVVGSDSKKKLGDTMAI